MITINNMNNNNNAKIYSTLKIIDGHLRSTRMTIKNKKLIEVHSMNYNYAIKYVEIIKNKKLKRKVSIIN